MAKKAHRPWDNQVAYQQLLELSGLTTRSKGSQDPRGEKTRVVKDLPGYVPAAAVSAIILDELSRTLSEFCNFIPESDLLREGRLLEAYTSVMAKCQGLTAVDPLTAWAIAQAKACVSKLSVPGLDALTPTIQQWWADEHRCRRMNQKVRAYTGRAISGNRPLPWGREVERAIEFVQYVLGDAPDIPAILSASRYGPGTSVGVGGDSTHYATKIYAWDATESAVCLAVDALALDKGAWEVIGFDPRESTNPTAIAGFKREARRLVLDQVVSSEKLMFVFKKASAMRSIGIQPTLNGMVQLGVDSVIKELLLNNAAVDLRDQTLNQRLAWHGSKFWEQPDPWCTLDKTSASNLVSNELVRLLIPRDWYLLLQDLRTPQYTAPPEMGGRTHAYEMYAGMGNGTTFAVESLIFSAMAYAVSDLSEPAHCLDSRTFSVYGDDVILKRAIADKYMRFADYLGFRMNTAKTFTEGPFRESCGADYWAGVNIRPAYVNGESDLNELELVGVHNTVMDSPILSLVGAAKRLRGLWKRSFPWPVPSDPQGGLGFRTAGQAAWEYVVRDGKPSLSPVWFRPRGYVISVLPKDDQQKDTGSYLALQIALHRGSQERHGNERFSLPYRNAIKIRIVPEQDLIRKDLVQMLSNQLCRLALRKQSPWWNPSRGK